ncbi:hypothetical protein [Butyrivibrio sp. VCD2006]|uniref:hypothetical protein n=1 Tax=Butyrivibrio sp. VCD2006 TaxID=1280664 RepID=UPI0004246A11|nr:hypothetical protein [Butyrivibrio sp. VCD2006]
MANEDREQNVVVQGKANKILALLDAAVKDVKILTDTVDSVNKTLDRRRTTDTDNSVKVSKAETDAKKEDNRHEEAKANIELEYKKIAEATAKGELKWAMIQNIVQMLMDESNKINNMEDAVFLSEESRASRDDLHKTMLELSKEIIRA